MQNFRPEVEMLGWASRTVLKNRVGNPDIQAKGQRQPRTHTIRLLLHRMWAFIGWMIAMYLKIVIGYRYIFARYRVLKM